MRRRFFPSLSSRLLQSHLKLDQVLAAGDAQRRWVVSKAVRRRIDTILERHEHVMRQMNDASTGGGIASLGKELSKLSSVVSLQEKYSSLENEVESYRDMLTDARAANDEELEEECTIELDRLQEERQQLETQMTHAVLPSDPDDHGSDAVLEIRAGTGGDEASLFALDLLDAYAKTARARGWKFETLSESKTDLGGIKDSATSISSGCSYGSFHIDGGDESEDLLASLGPYGLFKFESGVHRVQRIPVNDVRIHTSACSVAVLPSPSDDGSDPTALLPMSELRIDRFRASGAGGQHVNTTESAVRITHIPTGITAAIQDERSQHKNKAKALKLVTARVRDRARKEESRERGEALSSLMGGGDRSERIRTYNFPQDRVTDHRCKHSEHGIATLLSGADRGLVALFAPHLRAMNREQLLERLNEDEN